MTFGDLLGLLGRLHPMVLHLPIGLLVALAAIEVVALFRGADSVRAERVALAVLTALAAVVAVATGFILSREGGYGGTTLNLHLWLGILLGIVCASVAVQAVRTMAGTRGALSLYRLGVVAALGLMFPVGHLGASMTHGEDFLLAPIRSRPGVPGASGDGGPACVVQLSSFATRVQPILVEHCASCHGDAKQKGGLALHNASAVRAAMFASDDADAAIVPGDPAGSELVRRLRLPLEDDDHMPPDGKPQPTEEEIAAIVEWIADGASFEATPSDEPEAAAPLSAQAGAAPSGAAANGAAEAPPPISAADPAAIEALRQALVHVAPLHAGSPLLSIDGAGAASSIDDEAAVGLLLPVAAHVADLSLARSAVTNRAMAVVGRMKQLVRADLGGTAITDAALNELSALPRLAELVLVRTHLTDSAADRIAAMPALERVYLWNAGLSPDAVARLRAARPSLLVDVGDEADAVAIEIEPVVQVGAAALSPAPVADGGGIALAPVNTACPVTGAPVDPRYLVVYKGRVIGFCCPNCPKSFWDDPEKYAGKLP